MTNIRPWDPAEHLDTQDDMVAYLEAAFEDGNPALLALPVLPISCIESRHLRGRGGEALLQGPRGFDVCIPGQASGVAGRTGSLTLA